MPEPGPSLGMVLWHPEGVLSLSRDTDGMRPLEYRFGFGKVRPVRAKPADTALLPVTFQNGLALAEEDDAGAAALLHAASAFRRQEGLDSISTAALAVPSRTTPAMHERIRELAQQFNWNRLYVVEYDVAAARHALSAIDESITALVVCMDFDAVELSLLSGLKGVVRIRDRIVSSAMTHAALDELILAHCLTIFPDDQPSTANWEGRWLSALHLRRQLDKSQVAFCDLNAPPWPFATSAEVARDDLLPYLQSDVESLIEDAADLLAKNGIAAGQLDRVILLGDSPLNWSVVHAAFQERFQAPVMALPLFVLADGARLFAERPDDAVADRLPARVSSNPGANRGTRVRWQTYRGQMEGAASPSPETASDSGQTPDLQASLLRSLADLAGGLRQLAQVRRPAARRLTEQSLEELKDILTELDAMEPEQAVNRTAAPETVPAATESLMRAELLLDDGCLEEAVAMSHLAMNEAPEDPETFRRMIELHTLAAEASDDLETAIRWLKCAHSHDQSDKRIHQLLGKIHRQYAEELASSGDLFQALQAIQESLVYLPGNAESQAVEQRLRQRLAHP